MPIINESAEQLPEQDAEFNEASLFDESTGTLTVEASTIASFLNTLDYDDVFDHPAVQPHVTEREGFGRFDGEVFVECEQDAEGAEPCVFEELSGEVAAEFIDDEDLEEMFAHYVNLLPGETLEEKAVRSAFADLLESPFAKGNFRKSPFKGAGKNTRARMMYAMLKKGDIKRVGKGKGYKGGDYQYGKDAKEADPIKYKKMSRPAIQAKRVPKIVQKHGKIDPGRTKQVMPLVYKNLGKKMPKPWIPPEKRMGGKVKPGGMKSLGKLGKASMKKGDKLAKAKVKASAKLTGSKKAKAIADSILPTGHHLMEGSSLAAAAMATTQGRFSALNESATGDGFLD